MINEKLKDMHIKQKVMIIFSILLGVYIVAVLVGIIGLSVMGEDGCTGFAYRHCCCESGYGA